MEPLQPRWKQLLKYSTGFENSSILLSITWKSESSLSHFKWCEYSDVDSLKATYLFNKLFFVIVDVWWAWSITFLSLLAAWYNNLDGVNYCILMGVPMTFHEFQLSEWKWGKYQFLHHFLKAQFLIQITEKADIFSAEISWTIEIFWLHYTD